jgi:beta-lactamase superfamily II metal-dependent hydrolase
MFVIEMLPAQRGDCLWVTYGRDGDLHHVLVDGGPQETAGQLVPELTRRITALGDQDGTVELLVVSHVDADHIQGVLGLLRHPGMVRRFREVWFNGYRHLPGPQGVLGAPEGEILTKWLDGDPNWNLSFAGNAVMVPGTGAPKPITLPGGLEVVLLSPTQTKLARLKPRWEKDCAAAGLIPGKTAAVPPEEAGLLGSDPVDVLAATKFQKDSEPPNGSSIAFIASYDGKRALLCADAHPDVIAKSLSALGRGPHEFDAVKVPHHGSRKNISPQLLGIVKSPRWLFSSDGAKFKHPHDEAVARVIVSQTKTTLMFNYRTTFNHRWIDDSARPRYEVLYPSDGDAGLTVPL